MPMDWEKQGRKGILFIGFLIIALPLILFVGSIFVGSALIPSTNPFYPAVQNLISAVNSALNTILNPLILVPLVVVIVVVVGYALQVFSGETHGSGGYHS